MNAILGIVFHFLGGFASGSFYIPYKKVKGWAWESYWIVGGLFSWLIVPPLAAYLTIPNFWQIISETDGNTIFWTYIMGLLWGIGGLTYGLGVRYLGVSLGSSVILGLCSVFGSIIPSIFYYFTPTTGKDTIADLLTTNWGQMVLLGLLVCVVGIVICGKAGGMKDNDLSDDKKDDEFDIVKGLILAVISGVLSACFSFGIEAGSSMAHVANELWVQANPGQGEFLYRNNVVYIVILWGGLTTNLIWCIYLNSKNKSFGDYTNTKTPLLQNYIFSAIAGTTWFLQFFFYGMGESKLGNGPSSWILHMAFIIMVANSWGLVLKEWKGVSKKTLRTIVVGIFTIILSVLIVGYGNSLK
ncbi:RhaT l-rhamnose-proton symport 2 [Emticicia oligotrophica DSM 17448]|uniref:RhaT l-rhamnose-proton symport 2 n=1 Tax=Emticicia oligotrophica (strain DSM 17448 / CIP 109782 / MTCC 6937 / GPTSA100-15) TaxID=929562 RepID=A0ABM5N777_EMTOG|nr:L-rhamnose/proton symporter RhaT [Emticicia oligotrophica]AFK05206.1 RhaT l-rhamnose-proton symport 2 [Emticicia oligotrophica DSM 17448]